jgi:Heparinase II/III-like protein
MRQLTFGILLLLIALPVSSLADPEPTGPWHPEFTEHPRLLFDADDLTMIQERLPRWPYTTLMSRVRSRANGGFSAEPPDPYNASREYSLSNIAKAAAFVAWVDQDETMADRAAQALEASAPDFGGDLLVLYGSDIHIAEAVEGYCYAYDILAGADMIDPARLAAIEAQLTGLIATWYHDFIDILAVVPAAHENNHRTKVAAAFAAAGMTFNQHPDANKWFNWGMSETYYVVFEVQTTDGGVVAEGPSYADYSGVNHLPMFQSYDRLIGEDVTLKRRDFCVLGPNCTWSDYDIINPMDHPKNYATHLWKVKSRRPDGATPALDDSHPAGYFNGHVAARYNDGLLAWDWLNDDFSPLFTTHCSELNVEAIAFYDDTLEVTPPDETFGPHFILPDDGNAFFRSGWETDDSWLAFIAENGQARDAGGGHEHADNLSLSYFARGEYLLLDPGYIAWGEHEVVRRGEHHNVPTVDGYAPPTPIDLMPNAEDAFITDGMTEVAAPFVTGESRWRNTDFTRTVFWADNDYLIVADDMRSDSAAKFGVMWHGQAGGDSGFTFTQTDDGGIWMPGESAVRVHVASAAGPTSAQVLMNIHSFHWMQMIEHNSLDIRDTNSTTHGRFLSIALPYAQSDETPRNVVWLSEEGMAAARVEGEQNDFILAQPENRKRTFNAAQTGLFDVLTTAQTLMIPGASTLDAGEAFLDGNGLIRFGDKRPWAFFGTGRVWIRWTGEVWEFDTAGEDGWLMTTGVEMKVEPIDASRLKRRR